jgi:hypothetical protein
MLRIGYGEIRDPVSESAPDYAALHPGYTDQRVGLFDN